MTDYAYLFDSHRELVEAFLASAAAGGDMGGIISSLNDSPLFRKIAAAASDYERIGLHLHRKGRMEGEFTHSIKDGRLLSVERGIDDVEFTIRIDLAIWDHISAPEESEWVKNNPVQAVRKYWKHIEMPFLLKMKLGARLLTS